MAVKKGKTRIIFTLPDEQAKWLKKTAKKTGITTSTLIRWLIDKNVSNIQRWARTKEEYERLITIIRTPWIHIPENEESYEENSSILIDAHPEDNEDED